MISFKRILSQGWGAPLISCLLYCAASTTMILANKIVLSVYNVDLPFSLLLFQNTAAVILVLATKALKIVEIEDLNFDLCKKWLPVTFCFSSMLLTGFMSIKLLTVPMVTIFKNVTNILTCSGDYFLFGQAATGGVKLTLALMLLSATISGASDISFSLDGYFWMIINCIFTASYTLAVRFTMGSVRLSDFGLALHNNVLSLPVLILAVVFTGEADVLQERIVKYSEQPGFMFWLMLTGVIGFVLNLSSFFCIRSTSPTTYSIVGSLNKIPLTIASIYLFDVPTSAANLFGIALGLFSGVAFSYTKYIEAVRREVQLKTVP
eukprot:TRINITY_DN3953_c0_g1_i2.p1 TRINITY_DN3953_c0_g1~~TRINITY_DN3953_c0_g1_i2.p1  ORF type:complete len:321 (-),score=54.90 TRINITY_DN3953_c0_g1_i2:562-1524(-)